MSLTLQLSTESIARTVAGNPEIRGSSARSRDTSAILLRCSDAIAETAMTLSAKNRARKSQ